MEIFIAKQPIFNEYEAVVAYELLYRNKQLNAFPNVDADKATIEVIVNAFLSIGLDQLTNGKPCFINFTESLLLSNLIESLQSESSVIIELVKDIEVTPLLINRLIELRTLGYRISASGTMLLEPTPEIEKLFSLVHYCSVEFNEHNEAVRQQIINKAVSCNPTIQLVARKVETRNDYEIAKPKCYSLFQGYFFEHPKVVTTNEIPSFPHHYYELISLFQEDNPDVAEIAETIEMDLALTYRILQLANAASNKLRVRVTSIQQAIMLLGLKELQKWIYLLAMRINLHIQTDVDYELLRSSLFRAKACEQLSRLALIQNYDEYFLCGMLSNIDSIMARPLGFILEQLPLSETIKQTILNLDTDIAPYLQLAISLDKLDWNKITLQSSQLQLPIDQVELIYVNTLDWVDQIFSAIKQFTNNTDIERFFQY